MEANQEVRLRLIEAAARNPLPHAEGYAAGVLETAAKWERYVVGTMGLVDKACVPLGLPKKAT